MTSTPPPNAAGKYLYGLIALCCLLPAHAQNPVQELARDKNHDLHPSLRENLAIIGRYAESVRNQAGKPGEPPSGVAPAGRPEAAGRRLDTMVDPFEVSPQLREGRRSPGSFSGLPTASKLDVQRQIQVKALLVTQGGRGAQLLVRGQQSVIVKDGDLIDFGDLGTFTVHVTGNDGVTLSNPGLPQGNKITLR